MTLQLSRDLVWQAIEKELFALIGMATASQEVRTVGIVYAVWSGVGVALVTLVAWFFLDQPLDAPALAGLVLIVGGVVVINAFSKTVTE